MSKKFFRAALRSTCALTAVLALAFGFTRSADAGVINIDADLNNRLSGMGTFTGSIDYLFDEESSTGRLLITLTNTSPTQNRGFITGLLFNIDSLDADAGAVLDFGPPKFRQAKHFNAGPYGNPFDAGAGLRGRFMGGGSPKKGIAAGQTGTFAFIINASDAAQLTTESFINGQFDFDFVVRFRGFKNGGNDIVPAGATGIPGPSALALLAVLTVVVRWRRRPALS